MSGLKKIIFIFRDTLLLLILFFFKVIENIFNKQYKKNKNIKFKKKSLIIGNGPSFKKDFKKVLEQKNDSDIYVLNYFATTEYFLKLEPDFYFLNDPMFWKDNVSNDVKADNEILFSNLKKVTWEMVIICRKEGYKVINNKFKDYHNLKVISQKSLPIKFKNINLRLFSLKNQLSTPNFNNGLCFSLWYCLKNENKRIYLYGFDFTYNLYEVDQKTNKVIQDGCHFYEDTKAQSVPNNKYKIPKNKMMHAKLFCSWLSFYEAYVLSLLAKSMKSKIVNYTADSYLDCFDRPNFN